MAGGQGVWGIDVGQAALKAIKLVKTDEGVEMVAYDIIEHAKILSWADADAETLTRNALEKFVQGNPEVENDVVVIGVPGNMTFSRFVTLPPVEPERIPEIIKFEAANQIPFPIEEVVWDYEVLTEADDPEQRAGIFCIKREDITKILNHYKGLVPPLPIETVQATPLALYNFMQYDGQMGDGTTVLVNIGADSSDLVMSDGKQIVLRNLPLGGNSFTKALVEAFKLPYPKAENLKKTAATSKHAKQIFQAMRPVFADFAGELQRTIARFSAQNRDSEVTKVLGLGNAFQLPGLQKYLEQHLSIPVVKVDRFNNLAGADVKTPKFADNVLSFAVAYGLALQGLELSRIKSNLIPPEVQAEKRWDSKRPWFAAATGALAAGLALFLIPRVADVNAYTEEVKKNQPQVEEVKKKVAEVEGEYNKARGTPETDGAAMVDFTSSVGQTEVARIVYEDIVAAFDAANNETLRSWNRPGGPILPIPDSNNLVADRVENDVVVQKVGRPARERAKLFALRSMRAKYATNLDAEWAVETGKPAARTGTLGPAGPAGFGPAGGPGAKPVEAPEPGFIIFLQGATTVGCRTGPSDNGNPVDARQQVNGTLLDFVQMKTAIPGLNRSYVGKTVKGNTTLYARQVHLSTIVAAGDASSTAAVGAAGSGAKIELADLLEDAGIFVPRDRPEALPRSGSQEEADLRMRWSAVGEYDGDMVFTVLVRVSLRDVVDHLNRTRTSKTWVLPGDMAIPAPAPGTPGAQ